MKVEMITEVVGIDIRVSGQCIRLTQQSNYQTKTTEKYYRVAVFIPYLDSIIDSLKMLFAPDNKGHFIVFSLHPLLISQLDRNSYRDHMGQVRQLYIFNTLDLKDYKSNILYYLNKNDYKIV